MKNIAPVSAADKPEADGSHVATPIAAREAREFDNVHSCQPIYVPITESETCLTPAAGAQVSGRTALCVRSALLAGDIGVLDVLADSFLMSEGLPFLAAALRRFFEEHLPTEVFEGPLSPTGERLFNRSLRALG